MRQAYITAHSGCEDTADNSFEYLRRALEIPLDFLEVDVHAGPGGLYISHDPVPENLQSNCPSLREAFDALRGSHAGGVGINCDLKPPGIERAVWDLAVECGVSDRLVYSGTVSVDNMRSHPPMTSGVRVFLNVDELIPGIYNLLKREKRPLTRQELAVVSGSFASSGAECINVAHEICDDAFWEHMDGQGIPVSVWTVNDERRILQMMGRGAVNITTRRPVLALECRKRPAQPDSGL